MNATDDPGQSRVAEMVKEAGTWASVQPWGLSAEKLRAGTGKSWRWRARLEARASRAVATPRRRVAMALALALGALAVTLPLELAGDKAVTELRLASYSLRLPPVFHVTPYRRAKCWATTPVIAPDSVSTGTGTATTAGDGSPIVVATDASAGRCVVMTLLKPSHAASAAPTRVLKSDKPVKVGNYKGFVGTTVVRGSYGFNTNGNGGPFRGLPRAATYTETLVVLALAVPLGGRIQVLEVVEHGFSQETFLGMVSMGLRTANSVPVVSFTTGPSAR